MENGISINNKEAIQEVLSVMKKHNLAFSAYLEQPEEMGEYFVGFTIKQNDEIIL